MVDSNNTLIALNRYDALYQDAIRNIIIMRYIYNRNRELESLIRLENADNLSRKELKQVKSEIVKYQEIEKELLASQAVQRFINIDYLREFEASRILQTLNQER